MFRPSPGNEIPGILSRVVRVDEARRMLWFLERTCRAGLVGIPVLLLAACASYEPLPLDTTPHLARDLTELRPAAPGGRQPQIDLGKKLGATYVAFLAIENNPDLQAVRADRDIAEAQLLQAGLFPNPVLGASYGVLTGGPGTFDAWTVSLSEDIRSLVTISAQNSAAQYQKLKVDADVLWQEWQVAGKARLLYVDLVEGAKLRTLLGDAKRLLAERYALGRQALDQGNLTLTALAPDATALSDIEKTMDDLDRQLEMRRHELDALLGLAPEVRLELAETVDLPPLLPDEARRLLAELPRRRPDLVALQLGYRSEEEKLRGAILGQFPTLVFGAARNTDNSHILNAGPQITLDLPIFNRNQGNIAIETATRKKLYEEFSGRLSTATGEVEAMLDQQRLLERQLGGLRNQLSETEQVARHAEAAFRAGVLDERGYVDLVLTRMTKQQEILAVEQLLLEQRVALSTLLGTGMPAVRLPEIPAEENS
jgi:outer membrane protein TolC